MPAMTLPGGVFNGNDDPVCAGKPGQHAARLLADAPHQRDRPAHRDPAGRLEIRGLQHDDQPLPGDRRRRQGLPERRLRPEVPLRAGLCRQGPEGDGRGPGRAARHGELLSQGIGRLGRDREPACRTHLAHDRPGHLAVGQCNEDLPASGLQQVTRRHAVCSTAVCPRRGAPNPHQHAFCGAGRRRRVAHRSHRVRPDRAARARQATTSTN